MDVLPVLWPCREIWGLEFWGLGFRHQGLNKSLFKVPGNKDQSSWQSLWCAAIAIKGVPNHELKSIC